MDTPPVRHVRGAPTTRRAPVPFGTDQDLPPAGSTPARAPAPAAVAAAPFHTNGGAGAPQHQLLSVNDIAGARPKDLVPKQGRELASLAVGDIEGARPARKTGFFDTKRVIDPLNPQYQLPSVTPDVVTPPPPGRPILDVADIDGTKPIRRYDKPPRDIMKAGINQTDPEFARRQRLRQRPPRNHIDVSDITQRPAKSKRVTNPLDPHYDGLSEGGRFSDASSRRSAVSSRRSLPPVAPAGSYRPPSTAMTTSSIARQDAVIRDVIKGAHDENQNSFVAAFKPYDASGSGKVSSDGLRHGLADLGIDLSERHARRLAKKLGGVGPKREVAYNAIRTTLRTPTPKLPPTKTPDQTAPKADVWKRGDD